MKKLCEKLQKYIDCKKLEDRYKFDFKLDSDLFANENLFTKKEIEEIESESNSFTKNIKLKELISRKYHSNYTNNVLNFWLINNWGGIKSFKNDADGKNRAKINTISNLLKKKIENGQMELSKDIFETISSLSKLASFYEPENSVIYDSRTIYSLNWLILTTGLEGEKFFPMPSGRNKNLKEFDLDTIIRLKYKNKDDAELYYTYKDAYFVYCEKIKKLSVEIFGADKKPYFLEMLLFAIADKDIYKEIKNCTKLEIINAH